MNHLLVIKNNGKVIEYLLDSLRIHNKSDYNLKLQISKLLLFSCLQVFVNLTAKKTRQKVNTKSGNNIIKHYSHRSYSLELKSKASNLIIIKFIGQPIVIKLAHNLKNKCSKHHTLYYHENDNHKTKLASSMQYFGQYCRTFIHM